jgi:hypothetical protein
MAAPSTPRPEIVVLVDQLHPRAVYTLEMVLGDFIGLGVQLLVADDHVGIAAAQEKSLPIFSYGLTLRPAFHILPCCGVLYEEIIRQKAEEIDWFGAVSDQLRLKDILARIFYHLTQYPLLRPGAVVEYDAHGRYLDNGKGNLYVHALIDQVRDMVYPHLEVEPVARKWDYEVTIDVDQPWKYLHKPLHVKLGGLVRDGLRGQDTAERLAALSSGHDPFDVLSVLQEICPIEKTKVFFLVSGDHPNDSRFDIRSKAYRDYVLAYQEAGFEIGIHPSYASMDDPTILPQQKAALEAVVGPVTISRQHYLRYRTPETFRQLIAAGITRDYTLCRYQGVGAVTGIALPYRWFDLQRNVATSLVLVPALVMDRTLQQYLKLKPFEALAHMLAMLMGVKFVDGHLVIVLHNETFSDSGEWKDWLAQLRILFNVLQQP